MQTEVIRLGGAPERLRVIPMGVDLSGRFRPNPEVSRRPAQLLFVGRLVPKKGVHLLLQALPEVLKQYPEAVLTIAGFGPEESRLRELSARLQLSACVTFLGAVKQEQLVPLYREATVFVAPFIQEDNGDQEGLPVAMMEAIACECPIVVGDVAGVRDLLGDSPSQACVTQGDVTALAEAVCRVLTCDAQERQRQASALREKVSAAIDWDLVAARYAAVLDSVLTMESRATS